MLQLMDMGGMKSNSNNKHPMMEMYFHFRENEPILLFEWLPTDTTGDYHLRNNILHVSAAYSPDFRLRLLLHRNRPTINRLRITPIHSLHVSLNNWIIRWLINNISSTTFIQNSEWRQEEEKIVRYNRGGKKTKQIFHNSFQDCCREDKEGQAKEKQEARYFSVQSFP